MNNIINTYLAYLDYQDKTLDEGIEEINKATGLNMTKNYFSHLKSGSKLVSMTLLRYLVDECYEYIARQAGYRDITKFERAIDGLMPRVGK